MLIPQKHCFDQFHDAFKRDYHQPFKWTLHRSEYPKDPCSNRGWVKSIITFGDDLYHKYWSCVIKGRNICVLIDLRWGQWSTGIEQQTLGNMKKQPVDWAKLTLFCDMECIQKYSLYTNAILAILLPEAFACWNKKVQTSRMVYKYFSSGWILLVSKHSLLKYFTMTFTMQKSSKFEGSGPSLKLIVQNRNWWKERKQTVEFVGFCSEIEFTRHFIEFDVVKTKWFVGSNVSAISTRQTCGEHFSMSAHEANAEH